MAVWQKKMIESVIAFPGGGYPGTSVSVAVVTFTRESDNVKLCDIAGQSSYDGNPESIDLRQVANDIEKVWNYEGIVTRDWNYLLTHEDADLDPTVHLAAPCVVDGNLIVCKPRDREWPYYLLAQSRKCVKYQFDSIFSGGGADDGN